MKSVVNWWKGSPRVRFGARTVAVAIAGYIVSAWQSGITDWHAFGGGVVAAAITAVAGLLGLEPFVGVKPADVEVPVPPARPER